MRENNVTIISIVAHIHANENKQVKEIKQTISEDLS